MDQIAQVSHQLQQMFMDHQKLIQEAEANGMPPQADPQQAQVN